MLPQTQALIEELDAELPATRRVLERIPPDRFGWRPHPKSLAAGQLAQHVASIPGHVARLMRLDGLDLATRSIEYPAADTTAQLLATLDASVAAQREMLASLDAASANAIWRMSFGDHPVFALPRLRVIRAMAFNHWYHHRGELLVYLRLMDVAVPAVYGRSADEVPFAAAAC